MGHYGIDVSKNNHHPICWPAAAAELRAWGGGAQPFAVIKISEATGYLNPDAAADVAAARAAGMAVAGYLFDHGSVNVGAEQQYYDAAAGGLPLVDDDETPGSASAIAYAAHCQQLAAQDPNALVYLDESRAQSNAFPEGAGLYLAFYNQAPGALPNLPGRRIVMHQFTETGTVAGISGAVDVDYWTGTEAEFDAFFAVAPTPTPPLVSTLEGIPVKLWNAPPGPTATSYYENDQGAIIVIKTVADLAAITGQIQAQLPAGRNVVNAAVSVDFLSRLALTNPNSGPVPYAAVSGEENPSSTPPAG